MARPNNSSALDGIGKRISTLRHAAGVSQAKLAAEIGIQPSSIALYELEQNRPALEQLIKLADYFGTSTDALLGREAVKPQADDAKAQMLIRDMPPAKRKLALAILDVLGGG